MAWVMNKEPTKEVETDAGVVKLSVAERPLVQEIKKFLHRKKHIEDWGRKEIAYRFSLVQSDSSEENLIGYATVVYRRLNDIQDPNMRAIFKKAGLREDDKIAMLDHFYPIHSEDKKEIIERFQPLPSEDKAAMIEEFFKIPFEELKRKGIGSAILDEILEKCKSEGAKAAYCCTKKPEMQTLLTEKFGFQRTPYFYLKIL